MDTGDSLQAYFEQQNDNEAASIVAAMMALLPSNSSVISWDDDKAIENNSMNVDENVLNYTNSLLTKESEIIALKEVIVKWRTRALEAELNAQTIYFEQLQIMEQHENELRFMEARYTRKLNEKEDEIASLNEQIDYLISNKHHAEDCDTASFVSTIDYSEQDDDDDTTSIYDRDVEQGLVVVENRPSTELKSENILDSIQLTMRAIEQELSFHTTNDSMETMVTGSGTQQIRRHHRRSPTYNSANTYYSAATLIESESGTNKKIKKPSFFINRIFKKAFPKLYKRRIINNNNMNNTNLNLKYSKSLPTTNNNKTTTTTATTATTTKRNYHHFDSGLLFENDNGIIPRNDTDETLGGVYSSTTNSFQKPCNMIDFLSTTNNHVVSV